MASEFEREKSDQWPAEHQQVVWKMILASENCPMTCQHQTGLWHENNRPEKLQNISRLWGKLLTHPKIDQWPASIRQVVKLTNNLCDVGRFDSEKINEICETRKLTSDLPDISRLRGKPVTHPKIDQWPANIRQVEQLTNNLCYVSRFHPQEKVWINLLDGGRFLDTFSTCSYMAGCLEWLAAVTTGAELSSGVIKLTASLKKKTK